MSTRLFLNNEIINIQATLTGIAHCSAGNLDEYKSFLIILDGLRNITLEFEFKLNVNFTVEFT